VTLLNYAVAPGVITNFLKRTLPFGELDPEVLHEIARAWIIDYYPKGTLILDQGVSEVSHVHVIQRGAVKIFVKDDDGRGVLRDVRGEGTTFGAVSIIRGHRATFSVEAAEDTFCFLLIKERFIDLVQHHPRVAQFYLQSFSEAFVGQAYSDLIREKVRFHSPDSFYLFTTPLRDIIRIPPVAVVATETIQGAAARMAELSIGSLLVKNSTGDIMGIVTDQDLRTKVLARGLDYQRPVHLIMSSPVAGIGPKVLCFEALLRFMEQGLHHLVVQDQGEILGVVTARDVMAYQGAWPLYLFREIMAERHLTGIYGLAGKVPRVVRSLLQEGAKGENITRVMSLLHDSIVRRLLDVVQEELGLPPVPFCWLAVDGHGRREDVFGTEPGHVLVYSESSDVARARAAADYFFAFSMMLADHPMAWSGWRDRSGISPYLQQWRQSRPVWTTYFMQWLCTHDPNEANRRAGFFDLRPVYGMIELARGLTAAVGSLAGQYAPLLLHLAGACLQTAPPIAFFRDLVVEPDGRQVNRLDIKNRCLKPFVECARVLSLKYELEETNTVRRLEALAQQGHLPMDLSSDAREAFEFQQQLAIVHQLKAVESGFEPDWFIFPSELSALERKTLKESFSVIGRMTGIVKQEFPGTTR
jgi:CBS domain-containing protein